MATILYLASRNMRKLLFIILDNSTPILSTNQIYEIGQNRPITLVLKKLPRKFSLFIEELLLQPFFKLQTTIQVFLHGIFQSSLGELSCRIQTR
jgi:hypothetical protein